MPLSSWYGILALPLLLVACGGAAEEGVKRPVPPMGEVTLPSGRVIYVSLAITPEEQARGYMGHREIPPDEGMLFLNRTPAVRHFWMKNCLVPIDMIWLTEDHRIAFIQHSAPPCASDPCPVFGPSTPTFDILEVRGGTAREKGLKMGDQLRVVTDGLEP